MTLAIRRLFMIFSPICDLMLRDVSALRSAELLIREVAGRAIPVAVYGLGRLNRTRILFLEHLGTTRSIQYSIGTNTEFGKPTSRRCKGHPVQR